MQFIENRKNIMLTGLFLIAVILVWVIIRMVYNVEEIAPSDHITPTVEYYESKNVYGNYQSQS